MNVDNLSISDKIEIIYLGNKFLTETITIEPNKVKLKILNNDLNTVNQETKVTFLARNSSDSAWKLPNGDIPNSIKIIKEKVNFPFEQLPLFPQLEILVQSDPTTFPKICQSNKYYNDICNGKLIDNHGDLSHYLYEKRSNRWFTEDIIQFKPIEMTWKEFYERIMSFSLYKKKLKELYRLSTIPDYYGFDMLLTYAQNGKLMEIEILMKENPNIVQRYDFIPVLENAAHVGNLNVLKYFYDNFELLPIERSLKFIVSGGHLDVILWLEEQGLIYEYQEADLYEIIRDTSAEVLDWLVERENITIPLSYIESTVYGGNLSVFKWFLKHGAQIPKEFAYDCAMNEHLNMLKYLYSLDPKYVTPNVLSIAIQKGYVDIVKWYYETIGFNLDQINKEDANLAAKYAYLDVLKYLHSLGFKFAENIINYAASGYVNNYSTVKYLYSLGYPITSESLNAALRTGNLQTIKFLFEKGARPNRLSYESGRYSSSNRLEVMNWMQSVGIRE